jgi:hypothetical protein
MVKRKEDSKSLSDKNIQTGIIINAPLHVVWNNLMDFSSYPDWNPFIHVTGDSAVGSKLKNTIFLEGQKPQIFRPEVIELKKEKIFRWEGHLFIKGLFDGEHYFILESVSVEKTRLIHGENFKGIFSNIILKMIEDKTKAGFEKMNNALKIKCEQIAIKKS